MQLKKRFLSILFWSVISAAFIGPGTLATASSAGALFKFDLVWALVFASVACILLQECAARIMIASGYSFGEAVAKKFLGKQGNIIRWGLAGSVVFGCAAYQAGNILGALAGLDLLIDVDPKILISGVGLLVGALLWFGTYKSIANMLGMVVALMGILFFLVVFQNPLDASALVKGAFVPNIPANAELIVVGLIGTTIVPYNLFLASGVSQGQKVSEMRFGIIIAIALGGLISIAILIVGTQVNQKMTFDVLAQTLGDSFGPQAKILLALGLFAAGITSSITAPLASAITAKSLLGHNNQNWSEGSKYYKRVWMLVLGFGLIVGLAQVDIFPVIIMAQAVNGLLLPVVAIFLILTINDRNLIPIEFRNSIFLNIFLLLILFVSLVLGLNNLYKAGSAIVGMTAGINGLYYSGTVALAISIWVATRIFTKQSD
ncbi:MAG: divalent metal cation transporter [Bacteroidota bacterium]